MKKSTEKLFNQLTISAYGVLYSFRTFTFSPNETINEIKADNFTSFVKEYQPNFDRETGGMINLEDFVTERRMLGPRLLLLKRIWNQLRLKWGASSWRSSPLYCLRRNSEQITIRKTLPTLHLLSIPIIAEIISCDIESKKRVLFQMAKKIWILNIKIWLEKNGYLQLFVIHTKSKTVKNFEPKSNTLKKIWWLISVPS